MAGIATNISDISNELSLIYNLRTSEYYGIGKVKPITHRDRTRLWLSRNKQILEILCDVNLLMPSKMNICTQ